MSLIRDEHKDWKFIIATALVFIALLTFSIARDMSSLLSIVESWDSENNAIEKEFICKFDRK
jgi:hypothetical protein